MGTHQKSTMLWGRAQVHFMLYFAQQAAAHRT